MGKKKKTQLKKPFFPLWWDEKTFLFRAFNWAVFFRQLHVLQQLALMSQPHPSRGAACISERTEAGSSRHLSNSRPALNRKKLHLKKAPSWFQQMLRVNLQFLVPLQPQSAPDKGGSWKPLTDVPMVQTWFGATLLGQVNPCPQPVPLRTALSGRGARAGWLCTALAGGCSSDPLRWGGCGGERHSWKGGGEHLEEQH